MEIKNKLIDYFNRVPLVVFGIVIGVMFLFSMFVLSSGIESVNKSDSISVTGTAEREVVSDMGKWTFSLSRNVPQSSYSYTTKQINDDMENTVKYLVNRGVKRENITVNPVTSTKVCESQNQVIYDQMGGQQCAGNFTYAINQKIIVESSDVNLIKDLSLNAANILYSTLGIQVMTNQVEYLYTKLNDLRVELLGEATKNAKERASSIAKSTGGKIGGVKSATQGVFQVTQKNSTEISDYGSYDTSTIDKKVTAIVRVNFSVK